MRSQQRLHGGPDVLGVPRYDFSTNSSACGPCPIALAAVQQADARHYPDASYAALRAQLAAFDGVDVLRLSGAPTLTAVELERVWQLWTPNKALGLTGHVRGSVQAPAALAVALSNGALS